jgi:hypothetical protein
LKIPKINPHCPDRFNAPTMIRPQFATVVHHCITNFEFLDQAECVGDEKPYPTLDSELFDGSSFI